MGRSPIIWRDWITGLICLGFGCWVLVTGLIKAEDIHSFRSTIEEHGVLTGPSARVASYGMTGAEITLGIGGVLGAAIGGRPRIACAIALASLFLLLSGYATYLSLIPPPKPVGCGCGLSRSPITDWTPLAFRNSICTLILGAVPVGLSRRVASK